MHQLVHQDVREEGIEPDVLAIGGRQRHVRDRQQDHAELCLLHVLQHDPLGPHLALDLLVVRQVEGGRLHAAVRVARTIERVDHANGRHRPQLGVAQPGIDGQVIFQLLQLAREPAELLGLDVVAQRDEGLERGLRAEPAVLVDLVGTDGRLDAGVELHPRDVARVVVVGQERRRPRLEIMAQSRLLCERGCLAQEARCPRQLALVFDAVGDHREAPVQAAPDRREESPGARGVRGREGLHPDLDFGLRRVTRKESARSRLFTDTAQERAITVQTQPGSLVQPERMQAFSTEGRHVASQLGQQGLVPGPDLTQEDRVHQLGRPYDAAQRRPLRRRQPTQVDHEVDGSKPHRRLLQLCDAGHGSGRVR